MKHLTYLKSKEKRAIWLRAFHMWQHRPYEVAPLKNETHTCASCKTVFTGNYCPRCGQAAEVGRFSFKKTVMMFLDLWAIGNRSMLRTIRDLILRPGYMIRDYLRGMQMAYFPPFKMFFLLLALWLVVDSGLNIQFVNREKQNEKETEQIFSRFKPKVTMSEDEKVDEKKTGILFTKEEKEKMFNQEYERRSGEVGDWIEQHSSLLVLAGLLLFSLPLYLLFRRSPSIPD